MKDGAYRIVVMGVSGAGKSCIGEKLARQLGSDYIDGDNYHSPASIAKMTGGTPLDDEDRREWLETLAGIIGDYRQRDASLVLACSALKRRYRDLLRRGDPALRFLFLNGSRAQLLERISRRKTHFFRGEAMLDSQLRDLEPPGTDEALTVDIAWAPTTIVASCKHYLAAR